MKKEDSTVYTEKTTLAKEELYSNQEFDLSDKEKFLAAVSERIMKNRKVLNHTMKGVGYQKSMSAKSLSRVINALFDFKHDDVPVLLKTDQEKKCFYAGQVLMNDLYVLAQAETLKNAKVMKKLKEKKDQQEQELKDLKETGGSEEEIKKLQEQHVEDLKFYEKILNDDVDIDDENMIDLEENKTDEQGDKND